MSIIGQALLGRADAVGIEFGMDLEKVALELHIGAGGKVLNVVNIQEANKGNLVTMWLPPMLVRRYSSSVNTGFIIDNLMGFGAAYGREANKGGPAKIKLAQERMPRMAENFATQLEACYKATRSTPVKALLTAVRSDDFAEQILRCCPEVKGDIELLPVRSLVVVKYRGKYLHRDKKILDYFFAKRATAVVPDTQERQCCITGEVIKAPVPDGKSPAVLGITKLWAAKKETLPFRHWGKVGVANFPMEQDVAVRATAALKSMLYYDCPDPKKPGAVLDRRFVGITKTDKVLFWAPGGNDDQVAAVAAQIGSDATMEAIFNEDFSAVNLDESARVGDIYRSLWRRGVVNKAPNNAFFVMTLTANRRRFAITSFNVSSVEEVQQNIAQHFADLQLYTGHSENGYIPALGTIMKASLSESGRNAAGGWRAKYPAAVARQLYLATITDQPYPTPVFQRVLNRCRQEALKPGWAMQAKAAFLKAYVNRQIRLGHSTDFKEVSQMLDPNNHDTGYLLGRLLAIGTYAQSKAYPCVNQSLRQRFSRGLMATPNHVYPGLVTTIGTYIDTVIRDRRALGYYLKSSVTAICDQFDAGGPPRTLTQSQQVQFIQGFMHEEAEGTRKRQAAEKKRGEDSK